MPRTTLVLPTSTTSRLDIENRLLRDHKLARAHRQDLVAVAKQCAALIVDSHPCAAGGALADHRCDAIARFVNGVRPPFAEDALAIKWRRQSPVEMPHELLRRGVNAVESFCDFANRDSVRPGVIRDRFNVDACADQQEGAVVLDARLDEDAGD